MVDRMKRQTLIVLILALSLASTTLVQAEDILQQLRRNTAHTTPSADAARVARAMRPHSSTGIAAPRTDAVPCPCPESSCAIGLYLQFGGGRTERTREAIPPGKQAEETTEN